MTCENTRCSTLSDCIESMTTYSTASHPAKNAKLNTNEEKHLDAYAAM